MEMFVRVVHVVVSCDATKSIACFNGIYNIRTVIYTFGVP